MTEKPADQIPVAEAPISEVVQPPAGTEEPAEGAAEAARKAIETDAARLGVSVEELQRLKAEAEGLKVSVEEFQRLDAKAKELGKTVEEVREMEEEGRRGLAEKKPGVLGRTRERFKKPPKEEPPKTEIREYEVKESGRLEEKVAGLNHEQEVKLAERLVKLAQNVTTLRETRNVPPEELSPLENIVYAKRDWLREVGERVVKGERLESIVKDEASLKEFLGLAYYEVVDEIFVKAFETGKILKDNPERLHTLLRHPYLGEWIANFRHLPEQSLENAIARLSTHYTRETRIGEWNDQEIFQHFQELDDLDRALQESFFGPDVPEATIWQLLTATPASLTDYPRDRLTNYVHQRLHGEDGILTLEHKGLTIAELWEKDPDKAAMVLLEAKDRAMSDWISELAKKTLKEIGEAEFGEEAGIIKQAQLRSEKLKEPVEQERTVTQEQVTEAGTTYNEQKTLVDGLKEQLRTLETNLTEWEKRKRKADTKVGTAQHPSRAIISLNEDIRGWQDKIDDVSPRIANLNQEIRDLSENIRAAADRDQKKHLEDRRHTTEEQLGRLERARDAYQAKKDDYEAKRQQLLNEQIEANVEVREFKRQISKIRTQLEGRPAQPAAGRRPAREAVPSEQEKLANLEAEYKRLQSAFEEEAKRIEQGKPLPENQHLADGVDKLVDVAISDYSAILERIFGPDITARILANISVDPITGQIRGCEALRELIFNASIKKDFLYDPKLSREMLSDFTILKAVISYLNIDPAREVTIGTQTTFIQDWINQLEGGAAVRLAEAKIAKNEGSIRHWERELNKVVNPLLKEVLPQMRKMSKYEIGDFVQRIIKERVKLASLGTPFAEAPFEARQAPYRISAEAITHRGYGQAEFTRVNNITYGNEKMERIYVDDANQEHLVGNWNVRIGVSRLPTGRLLLTEQVQVNQGLLESLPDTRGEAETMHIPEAIIDRFYLRGRLGRLRRPRPEHILEITRAKELQWIQVRRPQDFENREILLLDLSYRNISDIPVALCNLMSDIKDAGQRFSLLHGFRPVEIHNIPPVIQGQPNLNLRAEMNNAGQVWLVDTDTGERKEMTEWFERKTEEYYKSRNLRELTAQQRDELQLIFARIQVPVGNEVANTLQRRRVTIPAMQ